MKMNRSIIILATVVVGILYSCQSQESSAVETKSETTSLKDTCFHLDMPKVLNQTKEVFLSDLARSIKYVPLETTNEYLIGDKTVNVKPCAEYIFISEYGKPIGVFEPEKEYTFSGGMSVMFPHFTYSPTGVLYNSWEDELIYRAKADGSFEPALSWSLGKLKLPLEPSSDYNSYLRVRQNYVLSINAWESEQNWCVQYNYRNHLEFAILNKESRECHVIGNPDNTQEGVYNDIDGGPSFWPSWYSDKGKRFFRLLQTIDLLDEDFAPKIELEVRDPKAAEAFHKIVSSIHENSNPVLMIVELK